MSGVLHGVVASLKAAAAAVTDAFFEYVALLLNTSATNGAQNNTFLDSSTNAFSITRNGNTTQGTFSPFSQTGWSNYFDGTGDWLNTSVSPATLSGDFTLEGWVYITSLAANRPIACIGDDFQSTGLAFFVNTSNRLGLFGNNASILTGTTETVALNAWNHVACVRSSGTIRVYLNGNADSTTASNSTSFSGAIQIGRELYNSATGILMLGYISNLRLVTSAVYTANFTPPTSPLTAITNTSLLTCQSNRFIDNSSNAFTITRNGDVSVQAFSPFNPTTAWSASTNGGSGYFDGTGDYLSVTHNAALNLSSGDFTIEAFVYWSGSNANSTIIDKDGVSGSSYPQYDISLNGSGFVVCYVGSGNGTSSIQAITSNTALTANAWNHLAFVRNGTTLSLYQNGVSVASATQTATMTDGAKAVLVGYQTGVASTYYFNGYISNLRVVKGTAVYTANFTPPTAPLTAITNTSLLCNFTNAGIYDSASGNDLETVGNAQVSTVQAKWGTTSMAFDGTGDWLTAIDRPALRFGTGPFTIECWLYLGATGAARGIIGKGTASTGWLLSTDASNKVVFTYTTSTITSTAALSGSTWYHIAVVREGTGSNQTKIYIDGTNDGTGTVSTDFNQTSVMYIGANRTGGDALNGYIDDLRITNGYARYTANFTPPTAAFPVQ